MSCNSLDHHQTATRVNDPVFGDGFQFNDTVDAADQAQSRTMYVEQYLKGTFVKSFPPESYTGNSHTVFLPAGYDYIISTNKVCIDGTVVIGYGLWWSVPFFAAPDPKQIQVTPYADHVVVTLPMNGNLNLYGKIMYAKDRTIAAFFGGHANGNNPQSFTSSPLLPSTAYILEINYGGVGVLGSGNTDIPFTTFPAQLSNIDWSNPGYVSFDAPCYGVSSAITSSSGETPALLTKTMYYGIMPGHNTFSYQIYDTGTVVSITYFGKTYTSPLMPKK